MMDIQQQKVLFGSEMYFVHWHLNIGTAYVPAIHNVSQR